MFVESVLDYFENGRLPEPIGNRDIHGAVSCGVDRAAGEDRWVAIARRTDTEREGLVEAMDTPEWADPALRSAPDRRARQDELDARVAEWTCSRSDWYPSLDPFRTSRLAYAPYTEQFAVLSRSSERGSRSELTDVESR
jgi:crotonobetainyl-CoA:carnitine CoA-transferase CaiB-like acyl-CoA transferase